MNDQSSIPTFHYNESRQLTPFDHFRDRYSEWLASFPINEPIYALPVRGFNHSRSEEFIPQFDAEVSFKGWCDEWNAVGVQHGEAVIYPYFKRRPSFNSVNVAKLIPGWSPEMIKEMAGLVSAGGVVFSQQNGAVGFLLTHSPFLTEREKIRGLLPDVRTPIRRFPDRIEATFPSPDSVDRTVIVELVSFMDKWGICEFVTWDFPELYSPQAYDVMRNRSTTPRGAYAAFGIPVHTRVPKAEDSCNRIEQAQRDLAEDMGIDPDYASLGHSERFEAMFKVLHLERSLEQRHRESKPPGFVGFLIDLYRSQIDNCTERYVKQLRSWIQQCLVGKRRQIKGLN